MYSEKSTVAMGAHPIGRPGWPELAALTPSIDRKRTALMASPMSPGICLATYLTAVAEGAAWATTTRDEEAAERLGAATVERRLPGLVVVRIEERAPFAVWQLDGKFTLVDRGGNLVTDSEVSAFSGQVPLIVGPGAPQAAAALMDMLAVQPDLMARMKAAVRVGERRWNLRMSNGADILLPEGAEAQALARLAELQASLQLLDRPLQAVDLRLPDRLVIRPSTPPADRPASRKPT